MNAVADTTAENHIHVRSLQMYLQHQHADPRFVAVLFVDALQRMVRIAQEGISSRLPGRVQSWCTGAAAKSKQEMADVRTETN